MPNRNETSRSSMVQKHVPEKEWSRIESIVNDELNRMVERIYEKVLRSKRANLFQNLKINEKSFFTSVLATAERAAGHHNNDISILFDIDESIATQSNNQILLRPSLLPLLRVLRKRKWGVGLLTSWGDSDGQLRSNDALASIREYISSDLVFSSFRYAHNDRLKNDLQGIKEVITAKTAGNTTNPVSQFSDDNAGKILKLVEIRRGLSHRGLVVVDDMPYTRILNEDNGLYGVHLDHAKKGGGAFLLYP